MTDEQRPIRKIIYDAIIKSHGLDDGDCFLTHQCPDYDMAVEGGCEDGTCFCHKLIDDAVSDVLKAVRAK